VVEVVVAAHQEAQVVDLAQAALALSFFAHPMP